MLNKIMIADNYIKKKKGDEMNIYREPVIRWDV